jgi:hypothetical protein
MAGLSQVPSHHNPPSCSINPQVLAEHPASMAIMNLTDGNISRCISVVIPNTIDHAAPVLFDFHGAGGNAHNYGLHADAQGVQWVSLASKFKFILVGGEAVQWGGAPPPGPPPVPADCIQCFKDAGCHDGRECDACCQRNMGPCSRICGPEHVPFPSAQAAVCGASDATVEQRRLIAPSAWGWWDPEFEPELALELELAEEQPQLVETGAMEEAAHVQRRRLLETTKLQQVGGLQQAAGIVRPGPSRPSVRQGAGAPRRPIGSVSVSHPQSHVRHGRHGRRPNAGEWQGGQWLIPEVQTDATGIQCDWQASRELRYIESAMARLSALGVVNRSRVFFTGCSMGSALTVWLAQCYHARYPQATTAFASQSTGLKVKGDGLRLPPDNYDPQYTWGECPTCQYFPAPVVPTSGLKACVVDQTGDGDFYRSSLALHQAWGVVAGMPTNISITGGGHCMTDSFEWIARCLDDGTGRLLRVLGSGRLR